MEFSYWPPKSAIFLLMMPKNNWFKAAKHLKSALVNENPRIFVY